MKQTRVTVAWEDGLHLRSATRLVRLAQSFRSNICVRFGSRIADARSVLSILILSAGLGAPLDIEASGVDEVDAISAIEQFFTDSGDVSQEFEVVPHRLGREKNSR